MRVALRTWVMKPTGKIFIAMHNGQGTLPQVGYRLKRPPHSRHACANEWVVSQLESNYLLQKAMFWISKYPSAWHRVASSKLRWKLIQRLNEEPEDLLTICYATKHDISPSYGLKHSLTANSLEKFYLCLIQSVPYAYQANLICGGLWITALRLHIQESIRMPGGIKCVNSCGPRINFLRDHPNNNRCNSWWRHIPGGIKCRMGHQ